MKNPFTPAFGAIPPVLAGRSDILGDMRVALENGTGDPNLSTLVVGARGTGKTALLACMRDIAAESGWIAVGTTALPGMLEDIESQTRRAASHIVSAPSARPTSAAIGPVGVSWEFPATDSGNWRTRMSDILDALKAHGSGLLVTVDEVRADLDEMVLLAAVYQHFVTEGRQVSLVMAGLPYHVHQLVSNQSVSFLRRAFLRELARIDDADVADTLQRTFEEGGKEIDRDALLLCTEATEGFAYMLQLVGFRTWTASGNADRATAEHALAGVADARREFEQRVLAATYRELSEVDLRFLAAMLDDPEESRLADISRRMAVKSNYATKYKSRLLAQGVIQDLGSNVFSFALPGLRPYLERRLR